MNKDPWKPVKYDLADITAFQALAGGTANEDQQKRAVRLIIEDLSGTYDLSFRPGPEGRRDTDFAEGRRYVGLQLVKWIKLDRRVLNPDISMEQKENG